MNYKEKHDIEYLNNLTRYIQTSWIFTKSKISHVIEECLEGTYLL